jgi:RNA-binding protein 25
MMRTIFVGNVPEGVQGDEGMHRLLSCAGDLTRWTRAKDASDKPCTFGFAEFGDHDTLDVAMTIFQDVRVPKMVPKPEDFVKAEKKR